jgi:hypothetical protein
MLLIFATLLLVDLVLTMTGIGLGITEANPVYHALGYDTFIAIKGVGSIATILLVRRLDLPPAGVKALAILLALVGLSNALTLARVV